jgi:hypothetical protein
MAVIDADQEAIGVVVAGYRLTQLRRIYLVARLGRRMDVPAANEPIRHLAIAEQEPATLARRGLASVGHDLVLERPWEDQPSAVDQRPPAIAGMTMTSLPSGTAAPLPPRLRASSSSMYTFT